MVYPRNGLLIETIGNVVRAPLIVPAEGRLDRGRIARRMAALTRFPGQRARVLAQAGGVRASGVSVPGDQDRGGCEQHGDAEQAGRLDGLVWPEPSDGT